MSNGELEPPDQLDGEIVSNHCFDKSESTSHLGEDLDVPTNTRGALRDIVR
jgi:hypothetical protein